MCVLAEGGITFARQTLRSAHTHTCSVNTHRLHQHRAPLSAAGSPAPFGGVIQLPALGQKKRGRKVVVWATPPCPPSQFGLSLRGFGPRPRRFATPPCTLVTAGPPPHLEQPFETSVSSSRAFVPPPRRLAMTHFSRCPAGVCPPPHTTTTTAVCVYVCDSAAVPLRAHVRANVSGFSVKLINHRSGE